MDPVLEARPPLEKESSYELTPAAKTRQMTPEREGSAGAESGTRMQVRKRSGRLEPVDVNKIVRAVERCSPRLARVDSMRVALRTISGLYDGATTQELDELSIQTAASLIADRARSPPPFAPSHRT